MFKLMTVLSASLVLVLSVGAGSYDSAATREAIKKTALDYGEGWYEGSAERMERALHPDLANTSYARARVMQGDARVSR